MLDASGQTPVGNVHRNRIRVDQLDELFILVSRGRIRLDRTEIDSRFKSGWHADLACVKLRNNKHIAALQGVVEPLDRKHVPSGP